MAYHPSMNNEQGDLTCNFYHTNTKWVNKMTQQKLRVGKLALVLMLATLTVSGCNKTIQPEKRQPTKLITLATQEATLQPIFNVRIDDGRLGRGVRSSNKEVPKLQMGVAEGKLIVASKSVVQGFDQGQLIWATPIGEAIVAGVGFDVASRTAIVSTRTGKVVALDSQTGKVRWVQDMGAAVLAPAVIAGNRVLLSANNGVLHGLNLQSGASIWQFSTKQPNISVRGTAKPLRLDADTALFGTADGRIHALSSDSGKPLWTRRVGVAMGGDDVGRMSDVDGTPLVVGNFLYVTSFSGHLAGFDMNTGRTMFTVRDFATTHPVAHLDGVLIGTDNDGVVSAFHMHTGERLWQNADLKFRKLSAPVAVGRYVAFGDYEGAVHLLDKNGHLVGQSQKAKSRIISLQAEQNRLYAQTTDGHVFVWQVQ